MKKKGFIIGFIACLVITSTVYAASSSFFTQAQKFYNQNCTKPNVQGSMALACYVFDKVNELDTSLTNLTARVLSLETTSSSQSTQITDLNNRLASVSAQPSKAIKVIDANNNELGILVDKVARAADATIFVPSINKLINIESGEVQKTNLEYTTHDCTGTPYIQAGSNSDPWNYVISSVSSISSRKYYTSLPNEIPTARSLYSITRLTNTNTQSCDDLIDPSVSLTVPAVLITIPFSEPIAQPIQFKYQ